MYEFSTLGTNEIFRGVQYGGATTSSGIQPPPTPGANLLQANLSAILQGDGFNILIVDSSSFLAQDDGFAILQDNGELILVTQHT